MARTKEETREYMKEFARKRREKHLCLSCGIKTDGKLYCVRCRTKRSNQARLDNRIKREKGLCIQCGKSSVSGTWRCQLCKDSNKPKIYLSQKKRGKRFISNGLCVTCNRRSCTGVLSRKMCRVCYLKAVSYRCLNSFKYWRLLLTTLKSQNYICPYSGEKIVFGYNDSVDHILPKSRFPEVVYDPSNIQWVTRHVNHMKWDMTHNEFMEHIKRIQLHCCSQAGT